jgi:phosphoribosylanthranilate isomerase
MDAQLSDTLVKICGITNIGDARCAASAGADFLGYILHPKSPRYVSPPQIRNMTDVLRVEFPQLKHVGVFVDAPEDGVCRTVEIADLDLAQLHGAEAPALCEKLAARGLTFMKVLKFGANHNPQHWSDFPGASYYLCDTFDEKAAGGTGREFDHTLLPPELPRERMFLAGGLTADNVSAAIAQVHPFAVDVSSGVEQSPGRKDHDRVKAFIAAAKPSRR